MDVLVPDPVVRPRRAPGESVDAVALERDLLDAVDGEVRFDAGSRGAYSTDASNYRQVPIGVVVPRTVDAAVATVEICRRHGAPVLSRGGGTSLAGECTNVAVVIDWSKYCNRLLSVDADRRTCVVEPGIVLDHLNHLLEPHRLEFGPRPATHSHCTLGGMIGNNSCGATAQRTGKVVDNIARLEVLLYDGTRMWVGPTPPDELERIIAEGGRRGEIHRQLAAVRDRHADEVRRRFPDIPRRVSGYNLDSLLPEKDFDVAGLLVGSEGTLVTVLRAELELVPVVPATAFVVLGYPDIADAGDQIPDIVACGPIALEGIDHRLVHFQQEKGLNPTGLQMLPKGKGFLMVQMGGDTEEEADRRADEMLARVGRSRDHDDVVVYDDPEHEAELWEVRESGLGATARVSDMPDTWPGWEDSAVDPSQVGDYLRDLRGLFEEFGFGEASLYGHFGQGCIHCRLPFELTTADGVAAFRSFVERAADLVVTYGGSFSGEHGDGQARGELLPKLFGDEVVQAMGEVKAIFDPSDRMNPGKVVAPYRLDENLRLGAAYRHTVDDTYFGYPQDEGSFGRAVLRCVGVGRCRRTSGGVMCPSYQVTQEEEHSTRGRARLLFEMLDGGARGGAVTEGWRATAVRDALDLCLACKGCKSDCPVNVDMATYKAEFLAHHYRGRVRPAAHYSMGWLPALATAAALAPGVVNRLSHAPVLAAAAKRLAGVAPEREIPTFAPETFQAWMRRRTAGGDGRRGAVLLWPDTFTNHFHPHVAMAAVEVLEDAGWRVTTPARRVCCGLTWISTGQLDVAEKVIQRTMAVLRDHVRAGGLVLGLEPSCTAVFRSDAGELFPHDDDIRRLQDQTVTFAELLRGHTPGWRPPTMGRTVKVQTHCHHHAIMGNQADRDLLHDLGADVDVLDSGCCGLAGNFGFERGHYDVSVACAERVLLPAVREADDDAVVLADGFSCRTQIAQGDAHGRSAVHLSELVLAAQRGDDGRPRPEREWAPRDAATAPLVAPLLAGAAAVAAAGAAARARRRS